MARFLERYGDVALAVAVVGMVGMLVVPLPTGLIDALIAANIAGAVVLVLVSTYVQEPLRIASLPSILLLGTLFRLALNVSTTRLILLQADAGSVIDAFGGFVVEGNLIVGAVIFLILVVIQFVVVGRGAERVAEVGARFSLDALPGRQMAIDADLRSGAVDLDEARRQRRTLQRESQLYGAMDGAMKFVKGDAIAGLVITSINIGAGLGLGVWQRGMTAGDAVERYGLLTVGDGLVSQIPSILMAVTAGIVVTRVAAEGDGESHLARDIGAQLAAHPKAVTITAGLLVLLAVIPGLPTLPFLALGVCLAVVAGGLARARAAPGPRPSEAEAATRRLVVRHPSGLTGEDLPGRDALSELGAGIERRLGVHLPEVTWEANPASGASHIEVLLGDLPLLAAELPVDRLLALGDGSPASAGIPAEPAESAHWGENAWWIRPPDRLAARRQGWRCEAPPALVLASIRRAVDAAARELVRVQGVQQRLDAIARREPALVSATIPRVLTVSALAEVLRRLVDEGISIRPLDKILEVVSCCEAPHASIGAITERVRLGLQREISHQFGDRSGHLSAFLLSRDVEEMIRAETRSVGGEPVVGLDREMAGEILDALEAATGPGPSPWRRPALPGPILLTHSDIRPQVRRLVRSRLPQVTVLGYDELLPSVRVHPAGRITVGRV